jgi:acyl carrier protein phosphodiesterase
MLHVPEPFHREKALLQRVAVLESENAVLENTVYQLRHEISNLTEKRKLDTGVGQAEPVAYKYHALSAQLALCLERSGCELARFKQSYDEALKALENWGEGFVKIIEQMQGQMLSPSRARLEFMHSILDEMHSQRAQLTVVQNYLAVLEFNEAALRETVKKLESKNLTSRSVSVNRLDQILGGGTPPSKGLVLEMAPVRPAEDTTAALNKMKLHNCRLKAQRDRAEINTERLLLQLKQAKEQIAMAEESAASRELALENKLLKANQLLARLKEVPNVEAAIMKFEQDCLRSAKKHGRTRSNVIVYCR